MALKRWIDIDRRWNTNLHSRLSPVKDEIFCPSTEKNCMADSFMGPRLLLLLLLLLLFLIVFGLTESNFNCLLNSTDKRQQVCDSTNQ